MQLQYPNIPLKTAPTKNQESTSLAKGEILVVDDTPANLKTLTRMLTHHGYRVRIASNGVRAIRTVVSKKPDLILLNSIMSHMDGYEICKKLNLSNKTKDIPVIFISSFNEAFEQTKVFEAGGVDYITQPFQTAEVLARVEHQLRIQRLSKQLTTQNAMLSQEIEEHQITQKKLNEINKRYRELFEGSLDGIVIKNMEGIIIDANASYQKMLGYSLEELKLLTFRDITPLKWQKQEAEIIKKQVLGKRASEVFEKEYIKKDGTILSAELTVHCQKNEYEQPQVIWAVVREISERKQAEQERVQLIASLNKSESVLKETKRVNHLDEPGNLLGEAGKANDITELKHKQESLRLIVEGTASDIGHEFMRSCVRYLAQVLQVRYALISECLDDNFTRMRSLAFWRGENWGETIEYDLAGTPCEAIREKKTYFYRQQLQTLFPNDLFLVELNAQSCLGIPLIDSHEKVIGCLIVLDTKPMTSHAELESILHIFASRAAAELERQHTEFALRESQHFIQRIADASPNLCYIYDQIEQRNIYANRELAVILGYTPEEIQAMGSAFLPKIIHPEDLSKFTEHLKHWDTATDQDIFEIEYRIRNAQGEWLTHLSRETVFARTDDGKVKQILGSSTDISERKRTEEALRISEERWQLALTAINAGIWDKNYLTGEVFHSTRWQEILGYQGHEIINSSEEWNSRVHPDDIDRVKAAIQAHFDQKTPYYTAEYRLLSKDDNYKWILSRGQALWDEQNNLVRFVGSHEDISERKQVEQDLRQSKKRYRQKARELQFALDELKRTQSRLIQSEKMSSLGKMVAGVAHEINNPVSFIYGNLTPARGYFQDLLDLIELYQQTYPYPTLAIQQLTEEIELDFLLEDWQKLINSMQVGAERIREIVRGLRNFSRLDEQDLKPVDIHEGIDNTLMLLQHRLRAENTRPEIEVIKEYGQLPKVTCYVSQLNQVFLNLLNNALDALSNQASPRLITIRTSVITENIKYQQNLSTEFSLSNNSQCTSSQVIIIQIADNGCGMSEQVREKIFDPFFTTKPVGSGTGLGLSISYQIVVEKHKGQISCASTPGRGTEFFVEIPVNFKREQGTGNGQRATGKSP